MDEAVVKALEGIKEEVVAMRRDLAPLIAAVTIPPKESKTIVKDDFPRNLLNYLETPDGKEKFLSVLKPVEPLEVR
jgi:hypothetical protein